jgi:hypothetical protein
MPEHAKHKFQVLLDSVRVGTRLCRNFHVILQLIFFMMPHPIFYHNHSISVEDTIKGYLCFAALTVSVSSAVDQQIILNLCGQSSKISG